jgi:hypothetical protein
MMDVWDPKDKMTVFSQIKRAINTPVSGFKGMTRVIVWSILIVFYFFIFTLILSGCAYFQKEKVDENVTIIEGVENSNDIIVTNLMPIEMTAEQKIACIKLLPECDD